MEIVSLLPKNPDFYMANGEEIPLTVFVQDSVFFTIIGIDFFKILFDLKNKRTIL